MKLKVLTTLSYLFHPLLIPSYALLILISQYDVFWFVPTQTKWILVQYFFVGSCLFPFLSMLIMLWKKTISSFSLITREERIFPYLVYLIFTGMLSYLLWNIRLIPELKFIAFSTFSVAFLVFILNFKSKISASAAGMGGLVTFLTILSISRHIYLLFFITFVILVSGFVGYVRLLSTIHKPKEVYWGYLMGILGTIFAYCSIIL